MKQKVKFFHWSKGGHITKGVEIKQQKPKKKKKKKERKKKKYTERSYNYALAL